MAIPTTDLTKNSIIVFERVWKGKGHDRNGCFGGDSPLDYVKKNKVLLIFFWHNCIIKQNDSSKQDYNLEGFFPIYFQIYGFENLIP